MDPRTREVLRLLDRYLVEIVETYDLCPWAKSARLGGEVSVEVLWGMPSIDTWAQAAQELLARPTTRVAMVIAPEIEATPSELRVIRNRIGTRLDGIGVAEFHPDGIHDDATAARLVPYLRRSPDPLLQLVPLALLANVKRTPEPIDLLTQAQLLKGDYIIAKGDVADDIADANHARVTASAAEVAARLADIADDRRRSYARVGITVSTGR